MTSAEIPTLNERFGLERRLCFSEGHPGMTKVELAFHDAKLELYLQGAHITRYQPAAGS